MEGDHNMENRIEEHYSNILEQVEQLGLVRDTDKLVIQRLAYNMNLVEQCEKRILLDGITVPGPHGPKEHPSIGTKVKAEGKIREAYILLGIDFASQLKKQVSQEGKDEWSDFL